MKFFGLGWALLNGYGGIVNGSLTQLAAYMRITL